MSIRQTGIVYGLIAASIWGGMYVVSEVVLDHIPPFTLLTIRLILGAIALGVWLLLRGSFPSLNRAQWLQLFVIGILGYGISLGFQFTGTKLSTAANGAVITAATPAFVYLFAWFVLGERPSWSRIVALIVSTIGVLLVIDPTQAARGGDTWAGNLLLVGAAVTWALYSVLVRRASAYIDTLALSTLAFIGGMFIALPLGIGELFSQPIGRLDAPLIAGILYLGIVSTAIASYLWNKAFELLESGIAALTFFAQPLVGAALSAWLLREQLTPLFLSGTLLILLGLWFAAREDRIAPSSARTSR